MQLTIVNSEPMQSISSNDDLKTLLPNEILGNIFDQVINQKCPLLRDISSILLTCKKWTSVLKENPCISLAQTLFQLKDSNLSIITLPQECLATDQKKQFTSQELNLIERAQEGDLYYKDGFKRLLMVDSELFHPKSLFLSLLDRYPWEPEVCKNSANENIRKIAEEQLSILNSLAVGTDEERLTLIQNNSIAKLYVGVRNQSKKWHMAQIQVTFTLKEFLNFNDKNFFIQVARCFGRAVFNIHESLKKDREVVLAAVQPDGEALELVDESLKKDREVVLAAIQQNSYPLVHADESLKKNPDFVLAVVKKDGWTLQFIDESLKKDRAIVLAAIQQNSRALQFADKSLKKDREIVLAAVKQDGKVLRCADESLKKDREIVLAAVKQHGRALQYADESLKKDREIVLAAIQQDGGALEFADESLKKIERLS